MDANAPPKLVPPEKDVAAMWRSLHALRTSDVSCVVLGKKTVIGVSLGDAGECGVFAFFSRIAGSVEYLMECFWTSAMRSFMLVSVWSNVCFDDISGLGEKNNTELFCRVVVNRLWNNDSRPLVFPMLDYSYSRYLGAKPEVIAKCRLPNMTNLKAMSPPISRIELISIHNNTLEMGSMLKL